MDAVLRQFFWGGLGYGGEVIRAVASFSGEVLAAASGHSELLFIMRRFGCQTHSRNIVKSKP